ncbi:MAG: hypothetical protein QOJ26_337 [Thermoplasmata archaeon]|jgi:hypothetical protein|nr:hypothetical protein [Thermoplasmata archaeon]MEA3165480.1 hypothetical protein [Thermoplasmata archaeon]
MDESARRSGGKARQAFGKSSAERPEGDKAPESAPKQGGRHAPSTVQGALDRMAAGMGERRRARDEARERASQDESA